MAAPRRPLADPDLGVRRPSGSATAVARSTTSKPRSGAGSSGATSRSRNRSRNDWWWPYSSPSRRDDAASRRVARRPPGRGPRREARHDALAREAIGVGRRGRLERHRARQVAVVEHDDDVPPAARRRPGTAAGCRGSRRRACHGARIVAAIPASASAASVARSTAVSGSHIAVGRPSEPHLEVAEPPQDLRPPVVRRRERQDRVVEGLGDPGPAALAVGRREPPRAPPAPRSRGTPVSVGPMFQEMWAAVPRSAIGR